MSKKNKKNLKKVRAKINNTPAKAEATKKEESKSANGKKKALEVLTESEYKALNKKVQAKSDEIKPQKKTKEDAKKAASKARIEARRARKKAAADMLAGVKKTKASGPVKITLEERKKRQEERRKLAEARHIASIKRRCSRMKLDGVTTKKIVSIAKKQWDSATTYDIVIVCDDTLKKRNDIEKLVKDCGIKAACITNSSAFLKNVPKDSVEKLRDLIGDVTFYQYRSDKTSPFEVAGITTTSLKIKKPKKGGTPHSIKCSKSRNINGYKLRKLKKAEANAKPVNKKPTQVKSIKPNSNKQAA